MFMSKQRAFTLVEMFIVLALLAIFAQVAVPAFQDFIEANQQQALQEQIVRAVQNAQSVGASLKFVLKDQQILIAEADHAVHHTALIVQLLGDGQCNGAAHAAAHNTHLLQTLGLGGAAQRADEVVDAIACVQAVQLHGGAADDLEDDVHSTLLAVIACDGEGDAQRCTSLITAFTCSLLIATSSTLCALVWINFATCFAFTAIGVVSIL